VETLAHHNITDGYPPSGSGLPTYRPGVTIKRSHLAKFLKKGLEAKGEVFNVVSDPIFGDVLSSHSQFANIQAVADAGLMRGCSTNPPPELPDFCPNQSMTRAQTAAVARNILLHFDWVITDYPDDECGSCP
jgi:hypothetical protein